MRRREGHRGTGRTEVREIGTGKRGWCDDLVRPAWRAIPRLPLVWKVLLGVQPQPLESLPRVVLLAVAFLCSGVAGPSDGEPQPGTHVLGHGQVRHMGCRIEFEELGEVHGDRNRFPVEGIHDDSRYHATVGHMGRAPYKGNRKPSLLAWERFLESALDRARCARSNCVANRIKASS